MIANAHTNHRNQSKNRIIDGIDAGSTVDLIQQFIDKRIYDQAQNNTDPWFERNKTDKHNLYSIKSKYLLSVRISAVRAPHRPD